MYDSIPETRYTTTADGTHIAFATLGDGPVDLVYIEPWFSHLEVQWEEPRYSHFLRRLASFSRLIMFDRRGTGLSDPIPVHAPPDLETRMDDILAVMDAAGSERAVVYGASESGALAALFGAAHPERTIALAIHGSYPRSAWAPDWPWGVTPEQHETDLALIERYWGTERYWSETDPTGDPSLVGWWTKYSRRSMSPGAALAYERLFIQIDVRDALPAIHVPTLILHREQDQPEGNRYFADHIPGATYIALPGAEHVPFLGDHDSVTGEIERFVRGVRDEEAALDRFLASVLFTDIVGSSERAAALGDRSWAEVVERHHATVRAMLARYRGVEVDNAGDGFFATFDGPARAVRCAQAIVAAVRPLGIEVRAGVHTGEVEAVGGKTGGMAVVIGARVGSLAAPSEVLATQTVRDLTVGSGLAFENAGEHELKGVQDRWRLYRVVG